MLSNSNSHFHCQFRYVLLWMTSSLSRDEADFISTFIVDSDIFCYEWRPLWVEMKLFRLFRGWDVVSLVQRVGSLLAPHAKYGIRVWCILCWLVLVCATVIYTHAEAFLRQTQICLTCFDQLPIRLHYPTSFDLAIARSSVWPQAKLRPVQCSL